MTMPLPSILFSVFRSIVPGLLLCTFLFACADQSHKTSEVESVQSRGETLVYECSGTEFIARINEEDMAIWFEDKQLVLPRVPSGSGTKYQKDDVMFWSKGEEAMLEMGKQSFFGCELAPRRVPWEDARRRGVDFRAVGNEPGWYLEIRNQHHILYVGDYGNLRVLMTEPTRSKSAGHTVYTAQNATGEISVDIVDEPCADNMSGEKFSSRVTLFYGGETYPGCGEVLSSNWE